MKSNLKKLISMIIAVVLFIVCAISLVACGDKGKNSEGENDTAIDNTLAKQYAGEIGKILMNSLASANVGKGFKLDLGMDLSINYADASLDDIDYSISIIGNVLNGSSTDINNKFGVEIKNKNSQEIVLGLYNLDDSLGVVAKGKYYKFKDASIMKALRLALVRNINGYENLGGLGDINFDIGSMLPDISINDLLALTPNLLQAWTSYGEFVNGEQKMHIEYANGQYTFNISLDTLKTQLSQIFPDVDLGLLPNGLLLNCTLTTGANGAFKDLDITINMGEGNSVTKISINANNGLFQPIDKDFTLNIPNHIKTELDKIIPTNLISTEVNSSVQFVANSGAGLRDMTLELKADINPFIWVEKGLDNVSLDELGYFMLNVKVAGTNETLIGINFCPNVTQTRSAYLYVQTASDNGNYSDASTNKVFAAEISSDALLRTLATLDGNAITSIMQKSHYSARSNDQMKLLMQVIILTLKIDITVEQQQGINSLIDSVTTYAETENSVGYDLNVKKFVAGVTKILGIPDSELTPLIRSLFGANIGEGQEDIKSVAIRADKDDIKVNVPVTPPMAFNPNDMINAGMADKVNDGKGYIKAETIVASAVEVGYGTDLMMYFADGVTVDYTGFNGTTYVGEKLHVLKIKGYDATKVGVQKVVLYTVMSSEMTAEILSNPKLAVMLNKVGTIKIEIDITVKPQV